MTNDIFGAPVAPWLPIPTISLWQPWAAALLVSHPKYEGTPIKMWETRGWKVPAKYIGKRLLVHAALKNDSENKPYLDRFPFSTYKSELKQAMQYGAIIGSVIVGKSVPTEAWLLEHNTGRWAEEEQCLGDYSEGRYAWPLTGDVMFAEPIPARGYQKIYGTPLNKIPESYHHLFIENNGTKDHQQQHLS